VPLSDGTRRITFAFVSKDKIALNRRLQTSPLFSDQRRTPADAREWRERFTRLAGSPVFAVARQDPQPVTRLLREHPAGFSRRNFPRCFNQLQWITLAGKPQDRTVRIVAERGNAPTEQTSRQLSDLLSGLLLMAQAGLNGPQTRRGLDPRIRDAYLEMIKGADVSRVDRGETKAVRAVFDVTSNFLNAVSTATPRSTCFYRADDTGLEETRTRRGHRSLAELSILIPGNRLNKDCTSLRQEWRCLQHLRKFDVTSNTARTAFVSPRSTRDTSAPLIISRYASRIRGSRPRRVCGPFSPACAISNRPLRQIR